MGILSIIFNPILLIYYTNFFNNMFGIPLKYVLVWLYIYEYTYYLYIFERIFFLDLLCSKNIF